MNASAELSLEVLDVGGNQTAKKNQEKSAKKTMEQIGGGDPNKVTNASRFLGTLEIPLSTTLHFRRGALASCRFSTVQMASPPALAPDLARPECRPARRPHLGA